MSRDTSGLQFRLINIHYSSQFPSWSSVSSAVLEPPAVTHVALRILSQRSIGLGRFRTGSDPFRLGGYMEHPPLPCLACTTARCFARRCRRRMTGCQSLAESGDVPAAPHEYGIPNCNLTIAPPPPTPPTPPLPPLPFLTCRSTSSTHHDHHQLAYNQH